jgi:hypothetical protein
VLDSQESDEIAQLDAYIDEFNVPSHAIKRLLIETQSIISGSLPLQAVLKERWENSDMDIYVPSQIGHNISYWTGLFIAFGYKLQSIERPDLIANNHRLRSTIDLVHSYVHEDQSKNLSIQLVVCNNLPFVLNSVDLSCTALCYNGQRLIALEDKQKIRERKAFMRNPVELTVKEELTERIKKYTERGFTIYDYSRSKIVDDKTFV